MSRLDEEPALRPTSLSILALLNNPLTKQTAGSRPGARDIPPVHLSPIVSASLADFSSYIEAVGNKYNRYYTAKHQGLHQHLLAHRTLHRKSGGSIFSTTDTLDRVADHLAVSTAPSQTSFDDRSSAFSDGLDSPSFEKSGMDFGNLFPNVLIPEFFSDDDFDLRNPRTFDLLKVESSIADRTSLETRWATLGNSNVQEKLSDYIDILETELVNEISEAAPAFFEALEDLKALNQKAESCSSKIEDLRVEFQGLQSQHTDSRLQSARGSLRIRNLRSLQEVLGKLSAMYLDWIKVGDSVSHQQSTTRLMKDVDAIRTSYLETSGDLSAVKDFEIKLDSLLFTLAQKDVSDFTKIFMDNLEYQIEHMDITSLLHALQGSYLGARKGNRARQDNVRPALLQKLPRDKLESVLDALLSTGQVSTGLSAYHEAAIKEAKAITKRELPSSGDDDLQSSKSGSVSRNSRDKSNTLARALNSMSASSFLCMLQTILLRTLTFLHGTALQQKVLIDVISSSANSMARDAEALIYGSSLTATIADICQIRIIKILNVRAAANQQFAPSDLQRYYELILMFNAECETLTGHLSTNMQNLIWTQTQFMFTTWYNDMSQSLSTCVELDTWQPVTLRSDMQQIVDYLSNSERQGDDIGADLDTRRITTSDLTGPVKSVSIDDRRYFMPISTAGLLVLVHEICRSCEALPPIRSIGISSMLESLKQYNSRACQLILGAGATKSAGLERITAKHLASTSQAISILAVLLPNIKRAISRYGPSVEVYLNEFESVEKVSSAKQVMLMTS